LAIGDDWLVDACEHHSIRPLGRAGLSMTHTTDFIAELLRAANEVGKLTAFEKSRLLARSVQTIYELRGQVNLTGREAGNDVATEIDLVAKQIQTMPDKVVVVALLEAAEVIRALKIVLDAKEEVLRGE